MLNLHDKLETGIQFKTSDLRIYGGFVSRNFEKLIIKNCVHMESYQFPTGSGLKFNYIQSFRYSKRAFMLTFEQTYICQGSYLKLFCISGWMG